MATGNLAGNNYSGLNLSSVPHLEATPSLAYLPSTVRPRLGVHEDTQPVAPLGDKRMYRLAKRWVDIGLATLLAAPVGAVGLLLAILLKLNSRGPLFYRHCRIGYQGRTFHMWKFRTMRVDGDRLLAEYFQQHPAALLEWKRCHKLKNDPRVTQFGQFLRMTSLDELPQLLNVLSGDMSFVGPRPIVSEEVDKYARRFDFYCAAKPGITGLWQVSGRNEVDYSERIALDEKYVREWSPMLDARIFLRTFVTVWHRHGAY